MHRLDPDARPVVARATEMENGAGIDAQRDRFLQLHGAVTGVAAGVAKDIAGPSPCGPVGGRCRLVTLITERAIGGA